MALVTCIRRGRDRIRTGVGFSGNGLRLLTGTRQLPGSCIPTIGGIENTQYPPIRFCSNSQDSQAPACPTSGISSGDDHSQASFPPAAVHQLQLQAVIATLSSQSTACFSSPPHLPCAIPRHTCFSHSLTHRHTIHRTAHRSLTSLFSPTLARAFSSLKYPPSQDTPLPPLDPSSTHSSTPTSSSSSPRHSPFTTTATVEDTTIPITIHQSGQIPKAINALAATNLTLATTKHCVLDDHRSAPSSLQDENSLQDESSPPAPPPLLLTTVTPCSEALIGVDGEGGPAVAAELDMENPGERREGVMAEQVVPEVWGRVHSIESFSAVDGPAVRSVVFLQGCWRRCVFCANPDTWSMSDEAQHLSSKDIAARLRRNLPYYEGGGGVTISGGEPMLQPHFVASVFKEAHRMGITTAIDTAGQGSAQDWAEVLPHTDTVLMCTKAMDRRLYFQMVQLKQQIMFDFAKAVADYNVPLVLRFVLVPGMTDTKEEVQALVDFALKQPTLVGIEMLPYHRLGVNKWEALGLKYPLEGMEPPPKEVVNHWRSYIAEQGIRVML